MIDFIFHDFFFFCLLWAILFVPGFLLVRLLDKKRIFDSWEQGVLSVVLSISLATGTGIVFDLAHIPINAFLLVLVYGLWMVAFGLWVRRQGKEKKESSQEKSPVPIAFLVIFAILVLLKGMFLIQNPIPISTDFGHHMYWAQSIVETGNLPVYEEQEILMAESLEENHRVSEPKPISDVIIGEHVVFAFISILSQTSLISLYPVIVLFFIHIITLLGVYALARRLFIPFRYREAMALTALFVAGILFGLDSPQMKYVTGGAVGNVMGNLFIVAIMLVLLVAVRERSRVFMALGIVLMIALAYTHHLSTLLLGFSLVGVLGIALFLRPKFFFGEMIHLVLSRYVLGTLVAGLVVFFFVWTPSYIVNSAVKTVVGDAQVKEEHAGIALSDYLFVLGEERTFLGLLGLGIMAFLLWKFRLQLSQTSEDIFLMSVLLLGWLIPLFLLIFSPSLLHIDIPTVRTANYTIIPLAIATGCFFVWFVRKISERMSAKLLFVGMVFFFMIGLSSAGWRDNVLYLQGGGSSGKAQELHRVAQYLGEHYRESEKMVMYDHINIDGGSWMKLYFMKDYNYPFYRALLFRYDRASDKSERCTLDVFSFPQSGEAQKCFEDLHIGALALSDAEDGKSFRESSQFTRVYAGERIVVYTRP